MIVDLKGRRPRAGKGAFVAENATLIGDVEIAEHCSIWFGAVLRADSNAIRIGKQSNVQDLCVLHVDHDHALAIGDDVTIGHRAILHGCTIKDRVLVGMGATIMNGAVIGEDSIVGAGALVTENAQIPPRSLVIGMPAKVKRELSAEEVVAISKSASLYAEYASWYMKP